MNADISKCFSQRLNSAPRFSRCVIHVEKVEWETDAVGRLHSLYGAIHVNETQTWEALFISDMNETPY